MTAIELSRRALLAASTAFLTSGRNELLASENASDEPFLYGLNTSTIRGQKLSISAEARLIAKAGYGGIEPWISELHEHVKAGGSLEALGAEFRDLGLRVESAIGFFEWAVDDDARRAKGFEEARRNMEMLQKIGATRIAAPAFGASDRGDMDLNKVAERYRKLLELGDTMGIVPQVEVWGFSKCLGKLGEAAQVAISADHPKACILADVYHLYKGGSGFEGIKLLNKNALHVFHLNDYPADPPRDKINDADRVYPGDGVAPLAAIFRDLHSIGFRGMLSVELFNKAYWEDDAFTVLETALRKLRAAVKASLAGVTKSGS